MLLRWALYMLHHLICMLLDRIVHRAFKPSDLVLEVLPVQVVVQSLHLVVKGIAPSIRMLGTVGESTVPLLGRNGID
jgi:hypothetical protein